MKRLLTAAVLCTVLILGSVWSVRAVDNTAQAVALDVENDRLNEARETWDAAQTLLGALLLHSEIDQADRLFDRVLAAQQNGLTDEFSLDRAELLAQLRHLPEVQRPAPAGGYRTDSCRAGRHAHVRWRYPPYRSRGTYRTP